MVRFSVRQWARLTRRVRRCRIREVILLSHDAEHRSPSCLIPSRSVQLPKRWVVAQRVRYSVPVARTTPFGWH
jgi:hypothetical protein